MRLRLESRGSSRRQSKTIRKWSLRRRQRKPPDKRKSNKRLRRRQRERLETPPLQECLKELIALPKELICKTLKLIFRQIYKLKSSLEPLKKKLWLQ
jgi:hypothetical protein